MNSPATDIDNPLHVKSFKLALAVMSYVKTLRITRHYDLASQLMRSATSVGANVREAKFAESKRDYLHKMSIALKESHETQYWIQLLHAHNEYPLPPEEVISYSKECTALLVATTKTLKQRLRETSN